MLEKARLGLNDWWRYVLVIFLAFVVSQLLGGIPLAIVVLLSDPSGTTDPGELLRSPNINQNLMFFLLMIPFLLGFGALVLLIRWLHKRTFNDTTSGAPRFRVSRFIQGFIAWFILAIVVFGIYIVLTPDSFVLNFQPTKFIWLVIIAVLLLPFQTGFEELMFRGYLFQGFGISLNNKWLSMLITSLIFAGLHFFNPEVEAFGTGLAMGQYILWGLFFGLITILDDGLELAWGAHYANNLVLALFITNEHSALQTPALLKQTQIFPVWDLLALGASAIIFTAFFWKRTKWNWNKLESR